MGANVGKAAEWIPIAKERRSLARATMSAGFLVTTPVSNQLALDLVFSEIISGYLKFAIEAMCTTIGGKYKLKVRSLFDGENWRSPRAIIWYLNRSEISSLYITEN